MLRPAAKPWRTDQFRRRRASITTLHPHSPRLRPPPNHPRRALNSATRCRIPAAQPATHTLRTSAPTGSNVVAPPCAAFWPLQRLSLSSLFPEIFYKASTTFLSVPATTLRLCGVWLGILWRRFTTFSHLFLPSTSEQNHFRDLPQP